MQQRWGRLLGREEPGKRGGWKGCWEEREDGLWDTVLVVAQLRHS